MMRRSKDSSGRFDGGGCFWYGCVGTMATSGRASHCRLNSPSGKTPPAGYVGARLVAGSSCHRSVSTPRTETTPVSRGSHSSTSSVGPSRCCRLFAPSASVDPERPSDSSGGTRDLLGSMGFVGVGDAGTDGAAGAFSPPDFEVVCPGCAEEDSCAGGDVMCTPGALPLSRAAATSPSPRSKRYARTCSSVSPAPWTARGEEESASGASLIETVGIRCVTG
mmetsp:Transcript_26654/g.82470  ORF Transcript_26654/g.82470 Transcript_26654/m.82470 type:complete len:221 (-) Transcript_26654:191-853(-)